MSKQAPPDLVPELMVSNLEDSLEFWRGILKFDVAYERPEEGFAMIRHGSAWLMLEEKRPQTRQWIAADLEKPFGRGINFEIQMNDIDQIYAGLKSQRIDLFMDIEEVCYRVAGREISQRQFLVQDPDGYLIRVAQEISKS